ATCSTLTAENADVVDAFLSDCDGAGAVPVDVAVGSTDRVGRRIRTGEEDMDGFYYACLIKR
ncbi:MAG TPA: 16S rRNA (cytosine(967)-C(5))-methyltransferase RsmB, partial [Gammaproteobacteria bacterium]|nr:16S rRNA (cytosine(967)-C(5))-methyltransferase RsmB [Gammaproteobacteria bacterium]